MMHFKDKNHVISKVATLLNDGGIFCLSIDKNQSKYINMGTRKLKIHPDTPDNIISLINASSMNVANVGGDGLTEPTLDFCSKRAEMQRVPSAACY